MPHDSPGLERRTLPPIDDVDESTESAARTLPLLPPLAIVAAPRPLSLEISGRTDDGKILKPKLDAQGSLNFDAITSKAISTNDVNALPDYIDPSHLGKFPRTRQKLDFFQLPKPATTSSNVNNSSSILSTLPVLSELRQPPLTVALFPPITPEKPRVQATGLSPPQGISSSPQPAETTLHNEDVAVSRDNHVEGQTSKRQYLRGRRQWTEQETRHLLKGVDLYGIGKWKLILGSPGLQFHAERTSVDLKDRYRTYITGKSRSKKRVSMKERRPREPRQSMQKIDAASSKTDLDSAEPAQTDFQIFTTADLEQQLVEPQRSTATKEKPQRFARWTTAEDALLDQAHRKHGFKWTIIAQDTGLRLTHRTAGQVRDRFRVRYPKNYESNIPLSKATDIEEGPSNTTLLTNNGDASKSKAKGNLDWLLQDVSMEEMNDSFTRMSKDFASQVSKDANPESSGLSNPTVPGTSGAATLTETAESNTSTIDLGGERLSVTDLSTVIEPSMDVDGLRNPNIAELLNDDLEPLDHLPPLKFPFDQDWSGDAYDDSLTLAPMVWGSYDFATGQWLGGMNGEHPP